MIVELLSDYVLERKFLCCILLQVVITGLMNLSSAGLAVTAVVLYSIDLATGMERYSGCKDYYDYYDRTPAPELLSHNVDICRKYRAYSEVLYVQLLIFLTMCMSFSIVNEAICKN